MKLPKNKTAAMWLSWLLYVGGLLVGYTYRALPHVIFYSVAAALSFLLWNGFVSRVWLLPGATIVDSFVFALSVRVLGMLWRGDKNPLKKAMRTQNPYE